MKRNINPDFVSSSELVKVAERIGIQRTMKGYVKERRYGC